MAFLSLWVDAVSAPRVSSLKLVHPGALQGLEPAHRDGQRISHDRPDETRWRDCRVINCAVACRVSTKLARLAFSRRSSSRQDWSILGFADQQQGIGPEKCRDAENFAWMSHLPLT